MAAGPYLHAFARVSANGRRLPGAHERLRELAARLLPRTIELPEDTDGDVE